MRKVRGPPCFLQGLGFIQNALSVKSFDLYFFFFFPETLVEILEESITKNVSGSIWEELLAPG